MPCRSNKRNTLRALIKAHPEALFSYHRIKVLKEFEQGGLGQPFGEFYSNMKNNTFIPWKMERALIHGMVGVRIR